MKAQTKAILASLVVIAVALSAVSGVTYSWWSDSENTDITVGTGNLDVEVTGISYEVGEGSSGFFTVDDVAPEYKGDAASLELITALSNVAPNDVYYIHYTVQFFTTVYAHYFVDVDKSVDWIDVKIEDGGTATSNSNVAAGTASLEKWTYLPAEGNNGFPALDGGVYSDIRKVKVTITIDDDAPMSTNGVVSIVNEITQKGNEIVAVSDNNDLSAAIADGATTLRLSDGEYNIPSNASGKALHFEGNGEDTVIHCTATQVLNGSDLSFSNLKIEGTNTDYIGLQHTSSVTYEDCIIENAMFLYADDVKFINCTFNLSGDYIWTYGADNVLFKDCVFYGENSKAILVYQETDTEISNVTVTGCIFKADSQGYTGTGQWTAAIEIDSQLAPANVIVKDSVFNDNYNGIVRVKKDTTPSSATVTSENNRLMDVLTSIEGSITISTPSILVNDIVLPTNTRITITSDLDLNGYTLSGGYVNNRVEFVYLNDNGTISNGIIKRIADGVKPGKLIGASGTNWSVNGVDFISPNEMMVSASGIGSFIDCTFGMNGMSFASAVYINSSSGVCDVTLQNCDFEGIYTEGAVSFQLGSGTSSNNLGNKASLKVDGETSIPLINIFASSYSSISIDVIEGVVGDVKIRCLSETSHLYVDSLPGTVSIEERGSGGQTLYIDSAINCTNNSTVVVKDIGTA